MAIDTAAKRLSMMDWGNNAGGLPFPDGAFSQGDRQHLFDSYSGLLFEVEEVDVPPIDPNYLIAAPARVRTIVARAIRTVIPRKRV